MKTVCLLVACPIFQPTFSERAHEHRKSKRMLKFKWLENLLCYAGHKQ